MTSEELGNVEREVLRASRAQSTATVEQRAILLQDTGASSVVKANASLARNKLVEPVPGLPGTLRLTAEGTKVAEKLQQTDSHSDGSSGGDSAFN